MTVLDTAEADDTEPALSIVSGTPTPTELAAVTAVIAALLEQIDDDALQGAAQRVSAWQRSQRSARSPLHAGYGAWRSFSG